MKELTLKSPAYMHGERAMSDLDLLRNVVAAVPAQGMTLGEMSARLRLLDALNSCTGDVLRLEDQDAALLTTTFQAARFVVLHPAIVDLGARLATMPKAVA